MKTISLTTLAFALLCIITVSCQRIKQNNTNENITESQENALIENINNEILNITDEIGSSGTLNGYKKSRACATFTIDTISMPHVITVDFGNTNCVGADGKIRNGKIIRTFTGKYKDPGSVHQITLDGYYVNGNAIKGYKTVTNNGLNAANNINWTIDAKDTIIKANAGGTLTAQTLRNREWTAGNGTNTITDDKYSITGSSSGVRANGNAWSAAISNALIIDLSCQWKHTGGTLIITPANKPVRTIDFGTGNCDNLGAVTVNGITKTFTMP